MKKLFLIMMAGLMAVACATLTPAEKAELARKVNAALDDRQIPWCRICHISAEPITCLMGEGRG